MQLEFPIPWEMIRVTVKVRMRITALLMSRSLTLMQNNRFYSFSCLVGEVRVRVSVKVGVMGLGVRVPLGSEGSSCLEGGASERKRRRT